MAKIFGDKIKETFRSLNEKDKINVVSLTSVMRLPPTLKTVFL